MKKNFMTPDVRIVRFESKDIIVTSDVQASIKEGTAEQALIQERHSIWD